MLALYAAMAVKPAHKGPIAQVAQSQLMQPHQRQLTVSMLLLLLSWAWTAAVQQ
jgi:hypothetical protein